MPQRLKPIHCHVSYSSTHVSNTQLPHHSYTTPYNKSNHFLFKHIHSQFQVKMGNTYLSVRVILYAYFVVSLYLFFPHSTTALHGGGEEKEGGSLVPISAKHGAVVKRDQRWNVFSTDSGEISAVKVSDGKYGFYHLQFITMEPDSLFLPVHLHSDMVFYVDSGMFNPLMYILFLSCK